MTIKNRDIAWFEADNMAPTDDGGGGRSTRLLVDGQLNQVLGPIADLDRVGGAVSGGKIFVGPEVQTGETWFKPIVYLTQPPDDPGVQVSLIAGDWFSTWRDARDQLGRYRARGALHPGWLLLNHYAPTQILTIFQRPDSRIPELGETLELVMNEGSSSEIAEAVVIKDVSHEVRTFDIGGSTIKRRIVTLTLAQPLQNNYTGQEISGNDALTAVTKIRTMVVVNAIGLRGIKTLLANAELSDNHIKVDSPFHQLVPATQSTTAATNLRIMGDALLTLATTPREVTAGTAYFSLRQFVKDNNRTDKYIFTLRPLPAQGSIVILFRASGGWYSLKDSGGILQGAGGGTANYSSGVVAATLPALPDVGTMVICFWGPNLSFSQGAVGEIQLPAVILTLAEDVATYNSVSLSWPSGGVTKTATVSAAGILSGQATGYFIDRRTIKVVPTAMIDAGGTWQISYQKASAIADEIIPVSVSSRAINFVTAQAIEPKTLEIEWLTSTQTTNTRGTTTGADSSVSSTFATQYQTYTATSRVNRTFFYTNQYPVNNWIKSSANSSVYTKSSVTSGSLITHTQSVTDDGAGGFFGDSNIGSVDYSNGSGVGQVSLVVEGDYTDKVFKTSYEDGETFANATSSGSSQGGSKGWTSSADNQGTSRGSNNGDYSLTEAFVGTTVHVKYRPAGSSSEAASESIAQESIIIDLCPYTNDDVVPGSLQFTWMGHTYLDINGSIYRDASLPNNAGILSGSMIYSGKLTLTDWVVGSGAFTLQSLWRQRKAITVATMFFRTASPAKLGSFSMSVLDAQGNELLLEAGLDGVITGSHALGTYNYDFGVGQINFGDWLLDSALTAAEKSEWWYNPADIIQDSNSPNYLKIWRPWPVRPDTALYNVVTYVWTPSTANAAGVDANKLPQDGRTEMVRIGDYAVVMHEQRLELTNPVVAGQTYLAGRTRIAFIGIVDAEGKWLPDGLAADGGLFVPHYDPAITQAQAIDGITFNDPLNLTGYTQPLTLVHRVEDIRLVVGYDIAGNITLNRGLSHPFPADESYFATALVLGNRQARVTNIFVQAAWLNHWLDDPEGDPPLFGVDETKWSVTDDAAIDEDWLLQLVSTTAYRCIGKNLGIVSQSISINETFAPTPQGSIRPWFTIQAGAFGAGGATGNCVRFKTIAAFSGVWPIMTVLPGEGQARVDGCTIFARGNAA